MVAPRQSILLYNNFDCANYCIVYSQYWKLCNILCNHDPRHAIIFIIYIQWSLNIYNDEYTYLNALSISFILFLFILFFRLNAFVNNFFIALCVPTLVFELFINMILFGFFFFHFIGRSFSLFSFLWTFYFYKGTSPEQYWRRTERILHNQPPRLHNVSLIVQYIVKFLKINEYIVQSFNVTPTYVILLHKPIYCAIILNV